MKLTLPQQDIYFEHFLFPEAPIYNIGAKIKIKGVLHTEVLEMAYNELIQQHDVLRMGFAKDDGGVVAQWGPSVYQKLKYVDFSTQGDADDKADAFMQKAFVKPFDLTDNSPLHDFLLLKVAENTHYFMVVYHHIITDGWGTSLMFRRLINNYNEILASGHVKSEYPFSYADFIRDDDAYRQSEAYEVDKQYWLRKFENLPANLFEKRTLGPDLHKSRRKALYIKREVYDRLGVLAKHNKCTTFHVILALLYVYFGRKQQNEDFAVALPVLNRGKSIFKKTVGLFMGVSLLRVAVDMEQTFPELLAVIRQQLRQDYRHQRFPLGKLIAALQTYQEKERLFNMTLSYEKQDYADHFRGTSTSVVPMTHQAERAALAIYIREFDDQQDVKIDFDYNLSYFDERSIVQVVQHFEKLVHDVIQNPTKQLYELDYLLPEEVQRVTTSFNGTTVHYPKGKTFVDVFQEQVIGQGYKTAIVDRDRSLSYFELDRVSDHIARHIIANTGSVEQAPVGVLLGRSTYTIATLIGILKAGKPYIPLDPSFPDERLQYIVAHSGAELIITDQDSAGNVWFRGKRVIGLRDMLDEEPSEEALPLVQPSATAYVLYTSGTTGQPKGVEVGHRSLLNFLWSMSEKPGLTDDDTLFAVTTYAFDISILEFFAPLSVGATTYIADSQTLLDVTKTIMALQEVKPTVIQATPSFFQYLFHGGWQGSKQLRVFCGGDLLSEDLAGKLLEACGELWNMYGPTETTIWSSIKQIQRPQEASNIGSPITNTRFYVLDKYRQLLPVGAKGNLYIGGEGLAKGYYKAPELTAQKFISDPRYPGLLYDTGDMGRWTENGELLFMGRNDFQVKIRGYRVELGDIETKLNLIEEIERAVVVAKQQQRQEAYLLAYVIKKSEHYDEQSCIQLLEKQLPAYMVPYVIIALDTFPLTPNRKVDRKALMERKIEKAATRSDHEQAHTVLQEHLVRYWQEVLMVDEVGIHDNFFALGGHSLNAVKLVHMIGTGLQYPIEMKTIFDCPTVASLSHYLETKGAQPTAGGIPQAQKKDHYAVTTSQYRIWLASQEPQRSVAYNMVAVFEVEGILDIEKLNHAFRQLLKRYEILRTNFIEQNGTVYQKIMPESSVTIEVTEEKVADTDLGVSIDRSIHEEFDLAKELLVRATVLQTDKGQKRFVFCTHHIILDGMSIEHFTKALLDHYQNTPNITFAPHSYENTIQYKDYTEWSAKQERLDDQHSFWKKYLADYTPQQSFVPDTVQENENHQGGHFYIALDPMETQKLKQMARVGGSTVHNVVLALLKVLVFKVTGVEDILIGTVNSGRTHKALESMLGMFVKTLPVRTKLSAEHTYGQILSEIHQDIAQVASHQDTPPALSSQGQFDLLVAYQNPGFAHQQEIIVGDAVLRALPIDTRASRLPLLFNFYETSGQLHIDVSYTTPMYEENTIDLLLMRYRKLIEVIGDNPSISIAEIDLSVASEQEPSIGIDFNF